jgi:hypothetical protein
VERIVCLFVDRKHVRLAAVQIEFLGGAHRVYLIWHRQAHGSGNAVGKRPASWDVLSASMTPKPNELNLRNKRHVKALVKFLTTLDVSNLVPAHDHQ